MVSGITPCAQECKWIDYFGEPPKTTGGSYSATAVCSRFLPLKRVPKPYVPPRQTDAAAHRA